MPLTPLTSETCIRLINNNFLGCAVVGALDDDATLAGTMDAATLQVVESVSTDVICFYKKKVPTIVIYIFYIIFIDKDNLCH